MMRIRTLFLVCMSVVAALGACLGGWMLAQMVVEYQLAGRVERAVEIDTLLFMASDKIGAERPVTGDALLASEAIGPATRAGMLALRGRTDAALAEVASHIASRAYPGAREQLAIVHKTIDSVAAGRAEADSAMARPKSERDPDIFLRNLSRGNAIFEAINLALDMGDMTASLHDGTTVELVGLSRQTWFVRWTSGRQTAPLMAAIDHGATLTTEQVQMQNQLTGVQEANWAAIATVDRRLGNLDDLTATIDTGREQYRVLDRWRHDVVAASLNGIAYPISALDLGPYATSSNFLVLKIRDQALAAAKKRVAERRRTAGLYVVIATVVLGLTMLAMTVVLIVLQRRIVSPVLALTEAIGCISRLEFNVAIPALQGVVEIGRMADALDALRTGAIAGERNKAQILRMSHRDPLTDLANRVALQDRLEQVVAMAGRGQQSALLCLDLDRFKAVNDTFGHPTGDLLLQSVAQRLLACVRDVDTVSRLGGDEFVIMLVDLDQAEQAAVAAQRIVHALGEPFDLQGRIVSIGCSLGIAITPHDATSAIALMKCADTALYRAKMEGKGTWRFFKPEMDAHLRERAILERELRDALQNEAFTMAYQPVYRLATNRLEADRLSGFEALLRWHHTEQGFIGPGLFVPIAEETGLIVPIGAWVLNQACAEATHWPDYVRVSVNLSAVQFRNLDLVQTVRQALADSGLAPHRLKLEITETVLLTNNDSVLAILREMHGMGIHIVMDDFGTGYSSLSYLRSFPFDTIKIDQSFVRDMTHDASSRAIIGSMVGLAASLGMTTTAEGVETVEQLAELRRQGCTEVQGYLFSKPVWADQARLLAYAETVAG